MSSPARTSAAAALAAAAFVLLPGSAAADVTVAASRAEAGARDVTITFRVTNDDPAVATTGLQVFLPTARPLIGVAPVAPDGWTARVTIAAPTTPVAVNGAAVPEIATQVAWQGTLNGDGYAVFPVDVARLPDGAGPLRFRVIQTFADGSAVEWSDLIPYGAPAPQHPALVVPYAGTPAAPAAGDQSAGHHHGGPVLDVPAGTGSPWWTVGLGAALVALVAAGSVALGRRQRRRFAALPEQEPLSRPGPAP